MKIYHSIDWLTCTFDYQDDWRDVLPKHEAFDLLEPTYPFGNFDHAAILQCGAFVRWHSRNPRQGINLNISGEARARLADMGYGGREMMITLAATARRFTRLDFAIDVVDNPEATIASVDNAVRRKRVKTRVRKVIYITEKSMKEAKVSGATRYFGSKKAEKFVRVYDKAQQMNLLNKAWLRVELQTRNEYATTLAHDMGSSTQYTDVGAAWIRHHVDFPRLKWFQAAMVATDQSGELPVPSEVGRKETDFSAYLDEVLKAIKKRRLTHEGAIKAFIEKAVDVMYYVEITSGSIQD